MTIANFFEVVAQGITGAVSAFANLFSGLVPLFWTAGQDGASGNPTMLLIFIGAGIAISLVIWGLNKIIGLARLGFGRRSARRKRA